MIDQVSLELFNTSFHAPFACKHKDNSLQDQIHRIQFTTYLYKSLIPTKAYITGDFWIWHTNRFYVTLENIKHESLQKPFATLLTLYQKGCEFIMANREYAYNQHFLFIFYSTKGNYHNYGQMLSSADAFGS